eukprot:CAMPEP_0184291468 /NCGR_PEP_ID=MMETSP1049-20130417/3480_1 /TAXON_ID=77928 /ORGANISM="Proteomonas sulcata, Strain CCMP704" /LENGTH=59 /DNA_ID=CAMNT_0026598937 /DNA_START=307 /DNA_END=486 /DNA_ORIENTATION=+
MLLSLDSLSLLLLLEVLHQLLQVLTVFELNSSNGVVVVSCVVQAPQELHRVLEERGGRG